MQETDMTSFEVFKIIKFISISLNILDSENDSV